MAVSCGVEETSYKDVKCRKFSSIVHHAHPNFVFRKLPAQHVEALWEHIYKNNIKLETMSSVLAFYLHHRVYPPPVQKAFDVLMIAFTDPKMSKKLKTVLFQTVEEMCLWLSPSCISDAVKFSSSPSVVAELLPCFLINTEIPFPEIKVYERLIRYSNLIQTFKRSVSFVGI